MSFANVKLILCREIRDQSRDRRTLFLVFVLPLLLYPLLGMSFFQISQFTRERPTRVLVVGVEDLADLPPLVADGSFRNDLFGDPSKAKLLELDVVADPPEGAGRPKPNGPLRAGAFVPQRRQALARRAVRTGQYDAALCFPAGFADRMQDYRGAIERWTRGTAEGQRGRLPALPRPKIIYTTANERSQIALLRLSGVLDRWHQQVRQSVWVASGLPPAATEVPEIEADDLADQTSYRGAALWSKILPVLLLIWALTGAFYPAVDLCAGEKERGTLETLLSSPAERSEIVLGKLLTIMLFSMSTAALHLGSIGLTGWLVFGGRPEFGPPPPLSVLWLVACLVPVSALFSALCLAMAAFARSSKEGQYYLMPLLLITMPLTLLPMSPGVELNLGNALIPVTGVVLLLRSALEGNAWLALQFLPVVLAVTLGACLLAIRWAVDQLNSETVLFRESERLNLGLWLRHLLRDRAPTPSAAAAFFCGALILVIYFVLSALLSPSGGFAELARAIVIPELAAIAAPALLMTILLTRSPRQTLLLRSPPWPAVPTTVLLVVVVHPVVHALRLAVMRLYPLSDEMKHNLTSLLPEGADFGHLLLLAAVLPAVCEELAFRGFILSGLRRRGHRWRAILCTAVLFGLAHGIVQQQLVACVVGLLLGYLAVQTGSILPCMLFHGLHNALLLATTHLGPGLVARWPALGGVVTLSEELGCVFHWPVVVAGALGAVLLLAWFGRLPRSEAANEGLPEAIGPGLSIAQH